MTRADPATRPSDEELLAALRPHLPLVDEAASDLRLARKPHVYSTSFELEEIEVRIGERTLASLLLKNLNPAALSDAAKRVRPAFLYDPARCPAVYDRILRAANLGTAECFATRSDPDSGSFWIVIENVSGAQLWQMEWGRAWHATASWLARMHARFLGRGGELLARAPLLVYDEAFLRVWPARALNCLRSVGEVAPSTLARFEQIATNYDGVVAALTRAPRTLLHGELYPSNILVDDREPIRICPVDWELAAIGPGVIDLAALTSGSWVEKDRAELVEVYRSEWRSAGGVSATVEDFETALASARLHLAIQWIGWATEWEPPPGHAHDWLEEALRLADRLEL